MARIVYRMAYIPHPWDDKRRADGVNMWCLVREVYDESVSFWVIDAKPIAMFNFDSDAEIFQKYLVDEYNVVPDKDVVELWAQRKRRAERTTP